MLHAEDDGDARLPATASAHHDADVLNSMLRAVEGGAPWHRAVLKAISEWESPEETLPDGRLYRYLTGGEAFDWLLLADRLSEELDGYLSEEERRALLFVGALPEELSDEEFRLLIGLEKYRAHLNYVYGIRVEEALQLAVEEEVHKEQRSGVWRLDRQPEDSAYERIYGKPRDELLGMFHEETGAPPENGSASLADLREFTYWLFKFRLRRAEPARIASDTRKGIAQLRKLELVRRSSPLFANPEPGGAFVEAQARLR